MIETLTIVYLIMIKLIKEDKVYHLFINQRDVWLSEDEMIELQTILNNR